MTESGKTTHFVALLKVNIFKAQMANFGKNEDKNTFFTSDFFIFVGFAF